MSERILTSVRKSYIHILICTNKLSKKEAKPFVREVTGLTKPFSSLDLLTYSLAWSIGSGILLFTVGIVNSYPGSNPFIALLIDAVMLFPAATVLYLLGITLPRVGGQYVWVSRLLNPGIGYFLTLIVWMGYSLIMGVVASVGASFLAQAFTITGYVTHSSALSSVGAVFTKALTRIVLASAMVLLFTLLNALGYKVSKASIYVAWYIPLIVLLVSTVGMIALPSTSAPTLWDKVFGAGSYQNVLTLSATKGWKPSLLTPSVSATLLASIPLLSAWSGWSHIGGWMAGEVKLPKRTMFFGTIFAGFFAMILMSLVIYSYQHLFGLEFVSRLGFVASSMHITPSIPLFAAVAFSSVPVLPILISFIIFILPVKDVLPSIVVQSRQLFAMAFDRLLPESLTKVSQSTNQPILSYVITAIAIIVSIIVTSPLLPLGYYVGADLYVLSVALLQVFTAITAILLPISNPELYKNAPKPANLEFGKIPLISIVGSISLAAWLFLLGDDFYGIFTSSVGYIVMLIISVILAIVFVMYVYFVKRLETQGIDIRLVGKEIPPE
jgi:Amino acid transporters